MTNSPTTCGVSRSSALFGLAIFLSGFAALAYQVAWQRALTQSIGSDSVSVVLIVTIFMVWLGVGASLARVLVCQSRRRLAGIYAAIEVVIGLFGVVSVPLLRYVNGLFADTTVDSVWADFLVNLFLLGLPIVGMGMTTPLIVHLARREISNFGRTVGALYGLNILGAALGAIVCGLVLLEWIGLDGATIVAGVLNGIAAAAALFALCRIEDSQIGERTHVPSPMPWSRVDAVAVLYGFGTLALQVVFFRILHAYLTLSTIVFPIILCAYLLLMSTGQWLGGTLADRYQGRLPTLCAALFSAGSLLVVLVLNMPPAWAASIGALRFTAFNGSLVPAYPHLVGDPSVIVTFLFSSVFMASVVAWSALFPVLLKLATRNIDEAGASFGRLYGMYTIGNVVGTFVTGTMLLGLIGTGGATIFTIFLVAAGCLLLLPHPPSKPRVHLLVVVGAVVAVLVPTNYYEKFRLDTYEVSDVFEGKVGVVTVSPTQRFYSIVDISRTASASALTRDPSPADQYQAWRWNHVELMALDPSFRPKRVLIIGIGHGYLPHALLDLPFMEEIVVVDLSQEIVDAVRAHTQGATARIFTDPRVRIVIGDGRRYVQSAIKRGEKFDLVQIKINEPWHAGAGNLFTVEFLGLTKRLLSPDGYLGVRPLLGHLSDGMRVFDEAIYPGYYHMFFKNGTIGKPASATVSPDIREAWMRELPGQPAPSANRPEVLEVMHFSRLPEALVTDANTDNNPTFEYYWLRQKMGSWKSPRKHLWDAEFESYRQPVLVENQMEQ